MNKNIMSYMNYAAPYMGNFINSLLFLEKDLKRKGQRFIYIFPKETKSQKWVHELINQGKKIYFLSGNIFSDIIRISRIIKAEDIKIIHLHFAHYKQYIVFKIASLLTEKTYIISHFHNHYQEKNSVFLEKIIKAIKNSNFYIGVSLSVAQDLVKKGFDEKRVKSIPNAIDFKRLDVYKQMKKEDLKIENKKIVLMFGFNYYRKGVDLAIKALKDVAIKENIVLLISLSVNKQLVENNIIKELGAIPGWIKILEARNDVATYYNLADVFLTSSREEGFCYAAVEAAYCKPLVVASDIPAQNALDIPYTFYYEVTNTESLKENILKALSINKEESRKISREQRDFVVAKYSLKKWSSEIINIYNDVLNSN